MSVLTVIQDNKETKLAFTGTPLLRDVLAKAGYAVLSPCGGKGTCGKCAVQAKGNLSSPSEAERKAGVRLACKTVLYGDAVVRLSANGEAGSRIETSHSAAVACRLKTVGAAVDIGTTTVVLKLFAKDGACIGEAACINPQRSFAADVIGRIDAALRGGLSDLQMQIASCIAGLLETACRNAGVCTDEVKTLVLTGNTAMLYLLTGRSPDSIARAPFVSSTLFGEWLEQDGRRIYLPPCMNAFVGADITCAVLASGMAEKHTTSLLCDIGTNGEIALWKDGTLYITSTAAGPAFEGAEISSGCGSIPGAIDRVWAANGRIYAHTVDDKPAVGICGSGLVDALAAFLLTEQIDETGAMDGDRLPLTANGGTVTLTQADIRAVQLAKAAVAAGIETVLKRSGTPECEIEALYLAGGFGNRLPMESAARIGLIPQSLAKKALPIGNAALSGAVMLLFDDRQIETAKEIARRSRHIELGGSADFNDAFVEHMLFE